MNIGQQHLHARKRASKGLAPYPHPDRLKRYFDTLMYIVGCVAPLALLPQVSEVYKHHAVAGLSLLTWTLLGVINLLWLAYALLHREYPVFVANLGMCVLNFSIVVGILLYR